MDKKVFKAVENLSDVKLLAEKLEENIGKVIMTDRETVRIVIAALLSGGHILLEDVPGSGKTMLAKTLAKSVQGEFKRIQMTPDLLPADITGINYFNMKTSEFEFVKGPVFTNILIADEINRATPKTQAGLLEAMEEGQVTVEGTTYELDKPFAVIATENPIDTQGVFPLPEAQIDRFAVKLSMKYPSHEMMMDIMKTHMGRNVLDEIEAVASKENIKNAKQLVNTVTISDDLIEYAVNIVERTREDDRIILGISQRGCLSLLALSKSLAAMEGREYVLPDDIKQAVPYACGHRIILKNSELIKENAVENVLKDILEHVEVPTEEIL